MYYLGLLQNLYEAPAAFIPCQSFYTGILFGQPTVVVTTGTATFGRTQIPRLAAVGTAPDPMAWVHAGIGPEAAVLCIQYLTGALHTCHDFTFEVLGLHYLCLITFICTRRMRYQYQGDNIHRYGWLEWPGRLGSRVLNMGPSCLAGLH